MSMSVDRLYRLTCGVRHYDWGDPGAPGRAPLIADLLGVPADGRPFAELWIGAHHTLPATVIDWPGTPRLDTLLRDHPGPFMGINGTGVPALPFLLKVLSCVQPLSIQAHPDRDLAARLHARDPHHYPDANHKPEIAVALTPFAALAGFRPAEAVRTDLQRVPALQRFFAAVPEGPGWLPQAYAHIFTADPQAAEAALRDAASQLASPTAADDHAGVFLRCCRLHPGDAGALSVFFLNHVRLEPGQALFTPPNEPHAYLHGNIIECMAASDNVVRAGLTRRRVDREVLLGMLTYRTGPPALVAATAVAPGVCQYRVAADEFALEFRQITGPGEARSDARVSLVLVLDGSVRLSTPAWEQVATRGTALVWPAAVPSLSLDPVGGPARWVRAFPAREHHRP